MFKKKEEKPIIEVLENIVSPKQQDFEADQNLIGLFSILLQVDKRINPQNYKQDNTKINL